MSMSKCVSGAIDPASYLESCDQLCCSWVHFIIVIIIIVVVIIIIIIVIIIFIIVIVINITLIIIKYIPKSSKCTESLEKCLKTIVNF